MSEANSFDQRFFKCLRASGAAMNPAAPEDDRSYRQSSWILDTPRKVHKSSDRTVTGLFSKLDGSAVKIESGMEFSYSEILDADRRVDDFRTQASPLSYELDGVPKETFFDFDISLAGGGEVLAAVKPKAKQASSRILQIVEKVAQIHDHPSRRFIVIDEDHLADHQVRNARLVNRSLREDPASSAIIDRRVLRFVADCGAPPQVVDAQIALGLHGRTLTSVARLMRLGLVQLTHPSELTIASRIVVTQDGLAALSGDGEDADLGHGEPH